MDLSIIIINWNSKDYLRECLRSLPAGVGALAYRVLVIDNASPDECGKMLAEEFPRVIFIQSDRNLGFAGGNNRAARQAAGDFLLFLNPDTVVEDGALAQLVQALRRLPDAGAVGARLLNSDGSLQTSCVQSFPTILNQVLDSEWLRSWFPNSRLWGMTSLFSDSREPSPVEAISGACVMIRHDLFARIGGFDGRYFMYSEDLDLSFKVQAAGFKCYYVPSATVIHHGGGSSKSARSLFSVVMMRESVWRFLRFNRGQWSATGYRLAIGAAALVRLILILPLLLVKPKVVTHGAGSLQKWYSILRWTLGLESWAREGKPVRQPQSACSTPAVATPSQGEVQEASSMR